MLVCLITNLWRWWLREFALQAVWWDKSALIWSRLKAVTPQPPFPAQSFAFCSLYIKNFLSSVDLFHSSGPYDLLRKKYCRGNCDWRNAIRLHDRFLVFDIMLIWLICAAFTNVACIAALDLVDQLFVGWFVFLCRAGRGCFFLSLSVSGIGWSKMCAWSLRRCGQNSDLVFFLSVCFQSESLSLYFICVEKIQVLCLQLQCLICNCSFLLSFFFILMNETNNIHVCSLKLSNHFVPS